jgi:soluble cytochrome b562
MANRRTSYTVEELRKLAEGLRELLGAIEDGMLAADAGTISRLEGATAAIQALAQGRNP